MYVFEFVTKNIYHNKIDKKLDKLDSDYLFLCYSTKLQSLITLYVFEFVTKNIYHNKIDKKLDKLDSDYLFLYYSSEIQSIFVMFIWSLSLKLSITIK